MGLTGGINGGNDESNHRDDPAARKGVPQQQAGHAAGAAGDAYHAVRRSVSSFAQYQNELSENIDDEAVTKAEAALAE